MIEQESTDKMGRVGCAPCSAAGLHQTGQIYVVFLSDHGELGRQPRASLASAAWEGIGGLPFIVAWAGHRAGAARNRFYARVAPSIFFQPIVGPRRRGIPGKLARA